MYAKKDVWVRTSDVLQKEERDVALAAKLDKVRTLDCRLGEEDAVVGNDADGVAVDVRKA